MTALMSAISPVSALLPKADSYNSDRVSAFGRLQAGNSKITDRGKLTFVQVVT